MKMETPPEDAALTTEAATGQKTRVIVTQVKSNRVVYFTDDPDYAPPMDGDWYYLSHYLGDLPAEMSLRNCWRWRFNGGVFTDTKPKGVARPPRVPLLDHNRKALLQILNDKIDGVRAQYAPSCIMGALAREQKLREAERYRTAREGGEYPMLEAVAQARNLALADAAQLVKDRAAFAGNAIAETERVRERFALAIASAKTEDELLALRERLLDEVYPRMTEKFVFKLEKTEPVDADKPLGPTHLRHERTRLRAQLRERINEKRSAITSQYVLDDVITRHKGALAERLLASKGKKPEGMDYSVLDTYAKARGLELVQAAREVLKELTETGKVLAETEKLKDTLLAEIAGAKSLADIRRVSARIGNLSG